jgi:hypothetical protein
VSKSREEVEQIVANKITDYRDKSKEKAAKMRANEKSSRDAKL